MNNENYGPFRWRGHLNWKDIVERSIAGFVSGIGAGSALGVVFWALTRLFG